MIKYSTYKYILRYVIFLYIIFILLSLSACTAKSGISVTNPEAASPAPVISMTASGSPAPDTGPIAPTPANRPILSEDSLNVRGCTISLGETTDSLELKLGTPNRIDSAEYDFDYYVYNNDYSRLLFIFVKDGKVTGFYTDSEDFNYNGITAGSGIRKVNQSLNSSFSAKEVLTKETEDYTIHVLMDASDTPRVTGIYVLPAQLKQREYTDNVIRGIELMVYDLTNSIRVRNDEYLLTWSSSAALSSRKHSLDMADNNFFDHVNLLGRKAGDRMREAGIFYSTCGENIIAGYDNAILSTHALYNSKSQREVILHPKFRYLGVGFVYKEESSYKTYITQNFYR